MEFDTINVHVIIYGLFVLFYMILILFYYLMCAYAKREIFNEFYWRDMD